MRLFHSLELIFLGSVLALADPGAEGAKPMVTVHFCLGPSTEQVELPVKLLEPEMVPTGDPKVTVAPPFLDAVLVSLTALNLEVPTRTRPKLSEAGDTPIAAGTFAVVCGELLILLEDQQFATDRQEPRRWNARA